MLCININIWKYIIIIPSIYFTEGSESSHYPSRIDGKEDNLSHAQTIQKKLENDAAQRGRVPAPRTSLNTARCKLPKL